MSVPLAISLNNPDPNASPATLGELVDILNTLLVGTLEGNFTAYFVGESTPAVENQDKIWVRTFAGKPIGNYIFYSGNWRKVYDAPIGTVSHFNGNPTLYFDDDGKGLIGGVWDGWQIMNGKNGSSNLSDRFILSAHVDESGGHVAYSGGSWLSVIDDVSYHIGGVTGFTLDLADTPRPARAAVTVGKWMADGNTPEAGAGIYGVGTAGAVTLLAADAGNTTPTRVATTPPFFVLAPVVFVGY